MRQTIDRINARRLYCVRLEDIREISTLLKIPTKTLRRWRSEDRKKGTDWDAERKEYIAMSFVTPKKIRNAVITRLEPILERLSKEDKVNSSEINALRVLLQSAKALEDGL